MEKLNTGDILLFSELPSECCMGFLDCCIKCCTVSKYSHSAMVIKNPPWAPQCTGTYVWESSYHNTKDPQDNQIKFGVQLTPLEFYTKEYPGSVQIYRRKGIDIDDETLCAIHQDVYCHKYDTRPKDWCGAWLKRKVKRQTEVFTCSAFVSYILTRTGVLASDTPWTIVSAAELSSHRTNRGFLKWNKTLGEDTYLGTYSYIHVHKDYIEL